MVSDGLELVRDVADALRRSSDFWTILSAASATIELRVPEATARVWLTRPKTQCQTCPAPDVCRARLFCLEGVLPAGDEDTRLAAVPTGRGFLGQVAESRALLVADSDDMTTEERTWAHDRNRRFAIGFPLMSVGRFFGVVGVFLADAPGEGLTASLRCAAELVSHALAASILTLEKDTQSRDLAEKIAQKTTELQTRVSDLEDTRVAMLNMMSDAFESHRELRALTASLEETVEERTKEAIAAKEEAERANRMKSQFLSKVSHELRTPMHGIMSFAKVGIRKIGRSSAAKNLEYFTHILESAEDLLNLINDLLDISKIEAGRTEYEFVRQSFASLVEDVISKYRPMMSERGLGLELDVEPISGVVFDRRHMRQVITNLIGNAMKFTGPHTTVTVRTALEDGRVRFEVLDQGPGIPEDEIAQVFEKFFQSAATRQETEGTGLGLSIARGVARDHGGDITCSNRPDGGAMFRLRFPANGPSRVYAFS